jgi:hypothetical protein
MSFKELKPQEKVKNIVPEDQELALDLNLNKENEIKIQNQQEEHSEDKNLSKDLMIDAPISIIDEAGG